MNILFTNIGRRVALVKHFKKLYNELNVKGKIIGVDMNMTAPAIHIVDKKYRVCPISHPNYISDLKSICQKENINLLISLLDTDLLKLSKNRRTFENIGTQVLISSYDDIEICQNKIKTYEFLRKNGINVPKLFKIEEVILGKIKDFPFILKPAQGSASEGVFEIHNVKELNFYHNRIDNPILQKIIKGTEYTVDVLVDFKNNIRCIVPRKRIEVRSGEVSKGITVKDKRIIKITKRCIETLKNPIGPFTVQGFLNNDGDFEVIEINPRFGGGHPLAIKAGADFPRWIIEMVLGKNPKIKLDGWEDGLVMLRYDDAIFIKKVNIE